MDVADYAKEDLRDFLHALSEAVQVAKRDLLIQGKRPMNAVKETY